MLLHISHPFTILIMVTGVSTVVRSPENVDVSCNNFQTTVYWNYTNEPASTSFKLIIRGSAGHIHENVTTNHQYDLTPIIWSSEHSYMDIYWVKITATNGTHESEIRESPTFTYNYYKTATIKCKLDFPPVSLSVKDLKATVSFTNPQHLYRELSNLKDVHTYAGIIITDGRQHGWQCTKEEVICKHTFIVHESETYCVRLINGSMFDSSKFNMVLFKDTALICTDKKADYMHLLSLAILLSIFVIVISLITLAVCKAKAWTMTSSTLPKTLASKLSSSQNMKVINFKYESICRISAIEPAISKSHSSLFEISNEDPIETKSNSTGSERSHSTHIGHMYTEGSLSESSQPTTEEVELISERPVSVHVEDSAETESRTTDSQEGGDVTSGYDCPHRLVVEVEMGQGDMVKGYGPA